jgi:hypothetical protein
MTSFSVRCDCGARLTVRDEHRGRVVRCRQCGRELVANGDQSKAGRPNTRIVVGVLAIVFTLIGVSLMGLIGGGAGHGGFREVDPVVQTGGVARSLAAVPAPPTGLSDSLKAGFVSCTQLAYRGVVTRPTTGTRLSDGRGDGNGELTIDNGSGADAVVIARSLVSGRDLRRVYVRSGDTFTIKGIPSGNVDLLFMTGTGWISSMHRFCTPRSHTKFSDPLAFTERETTGGVHYSQWTVTLHPVVDGDARTEAVDPSLFDLSGGE